MTLHRRSNTAEREADDLLKTFPKRNKAIVEKYMNYRSLQNIQSGQTRYLLLRHLKCLDRLTDKKFTAITYDDVESAIGVVNKEYPKNNTRRPIIANIKAFCKWMIVSKINTAIDRDELDQKIKVPAMEKTKKKSKDMIKPQELASILKACHNSRDRALIGACLYEAMLRAEEALMLQWRHVEIQSDRILIHVEKAMKNEDPRVIPIFDYRAYLVAWKADTEYSGDDDYVFTARGSSEPMSYRRSLDIVKEIAEKAGVSSASKKVTNHLFRHTGITDKIAAGVSESAVKLMGWGSVDTDELGTYTHPDEEQIADDIMRAKGIKKVERSAIGSNQCMNPSCMKVNPPGASRCRYCGEPMGEEALTEDQRMERWIAAHPERMEKMLGSLLDAALKARGL